MNEDFIYSDQEISNILPFARDINPSFPNKKYLIYYNGKLQNVEYFSYDQISKIGDRNIYWVVTIKRDHELVSNIWKYKFKSYNNTENCDVYYLINEKDEDLIIYEWENYE